MGSSAQTMRWLHWQPNLVAGGAPFYHHSIVRLQVGALPASAALAVAIGFLDHNLKASGGGSSWVSLLPARLAAVWGVQ
jgi:hypothetical protein